MNAIDDNAMLLTDISSINLTVLPTQNNTLEAVNWDLLGISSNLIPQLIKLPSVEKASLPKADVVVITWTAAEWKALHQVFCTSKDIIDNNNDWQKEWCLYKYEFDLIEPYLQKVVKDKKGNAPSLFNHAWGRIFMVQVGEKNILLIKSDMHLAQDGPEVPLQQFTQKICRESQPELILSIGTAGAVRKGDTLGSALISNQAYFDLTLDEKGKFVKEYKSDFIALNHKTVKSHWLPVDTYLTTAGKGFMLISEPDVLPPTPVYESTIIKANKTQPVTEIVLDSPVITTDTFLFGSSDYDLQEKGCIVEMDDAVVGDICQKEGIEFGFVRNISDPVINKNLNQHLKSVWAAYIYSEYGLASSFNGALTTWALLAGFAEQESRSTIKWYQMTPSLLRNKLTLSPITISGTDELLSTHCFVSHEQTFFVNTSLGISQLCYDEQQRCFVSKNLLITSEIYHTLTAFTVSDKDKQITYLLAYQQTNNRFDIFEIKDELSRLVFQFDCELENDHFNTIHAYQGYYCNLLMAYSENTGNSRIYQINNLNNQFSITLLWQKNWAPHWQNFNFFTLGKENFFFKTNTKIKRMVNIDHYMDTPTEGAHPVCIQFNEAETALNADHIFGIDLPDGPGLIFVQNNRLTIQKIDSDCLGWQQQHEIKHSNEITQIYTLTLNKNKVLIGVN